MTRAADLTGYEPGLIFGGCDWSPERQDACQCCAGSYCCLCIAGGTRDEPCEHDSFARHFSMPAGYKDVG